VVLSACYLLWSYERVFFGEVTHQKNRALPDTDARESWILVTVVMVILWMGIGSPFFTRRFAVPCQTVLEQMHRSFAQEATLPVAVPNAAKTGSSGRILASTATPTSSERSGTR
jgi:NADH-quinone oxidoreductase subunit M